MFRTAGLLDVQDESDAVSLLTLHASKGLEFDHVFLSGVNEGLVPLLSSRRDAEGEAEERRLLFVGLTRARVGAEVGYFGNPPREGVEDRLSSFLDGLPPVLLERRDREGKREEKPEPPPAPVFAAGRRVRHRDYGEGVITAADAESVVCRFDRRGTKRFSIHFCPLEILEGDEGEATG